MPLTRILCITICLSVHVSLATAQDTKTEGALAGPKIDTFIENTKNRPPRENLTRALEMFAEEFDASFRKGRLLALDLGAGAGNETKHLIELGWNVVAIDPAPAAIDSIKESVGQLRTANPDREFGRLDCRCTTMQEMQLLPGSVSLINASFSLPFVPQHEMGAVWKKCIESLNEGGVFTGHFFGPEHEWRDNPKMSFYSVRQLFEQFFADYPLELRYLHHERDTVDLAVGGQAYFDTITVVAQKVGSDNPTQVR